MLLQCVENMVDTMDDDLNFVKMIDVDWTKSVAAFTSTSTRAPQHDLGALQDAVRLLRAMHQGALPNPSGEVFILLTRVSEIVHMQYTRALREHQERQKASG